MVMSLAFESLDFQGFQAWITYALSVWLGNSIGQSFGSIFDELCDVLSALEAPLLQTKWADLWFENLMLKFWKSLQNILH